MAPFVDWMVYRDLATLLGLLEHAEFFNPQDYNAAFEAEREKLAARISDSDAREQVMGMRGFDWGSYIERSLRRAGFRDDDVQEHFHSIVVRLLVSPGKLFAWQPDRHGPLDRRFRNAVWNGIRNAAEKSRNRRKWMVAADPSVMADRYAGRETYSDLIDEFRQVVGQRLGKLAVAILDQRLSGEDTRELVGRADIGTPSAFLIKREVGEIKRLAERFAARLGDPGFLNMVARALEAESATVAKRQQASAARRARESA